MLGMLDITDAIAVADPCYFDEDGFDASLGVWLDAVPGCWYADAVLSDEGQWGGRVSELRAWHHEADPFCADRFTSWSVPAPEGWLGVDSGQMMAIASDAIADWRDEEFDLVGRPATALLNPQHAGQLSYNGACLATLEQHAGILSRKAVVSSTGYGDGVYPIFVRKNDEGKVKSFTVAFILPTEVEEAVR
jgi:hypothetical protein